jgi:hypothetical protein
MNHSHGYVFITSLKAALIYVSCYRVTTSLLVATERTHVSKKSLTKLLR